VDVIDPRHALPAESRRCGGIADVGIVRARDDHPSPARAPAPIAVPIGSVDARGVAGIDIPVREEAI
jgi:hypothetical protein